MTWTATVTINGAEYIYPDGPTLPELFVTQGQNDALTFHLGVLGNLPHDQDPKQPYNLGPYTVDIVLDGAPLETVSIPNHWWNARWTYYPTTVAITRTPAQIVAANRMFAFGDIDVPFGAQPATLPYGYMGSSNITIYMPTTGERPDIGLNTDNSAFYMLGESPDGLLQWAMSGNTCPMHYRDQNTGRPINLLQYPSANAYDAPGYQGSPWLAKGKQGADGYTVYGGGWAPQQAHYCEMSYMAYQATGNTVFLEDLQYSANFTVLCDASKSGAVGKPTVVGEYRGIAWAFRNLFMAHIATQDAEARGPLPAGCLPASYWKSLLDIQLAYYQPNMNDPANQTFRLVPGSSWETFGPWQVDYMLSALAFGVLTGHSDWAPFYVWALGNAIARTNNTPWQQGGYPPGWGGAYYMPASGTWYESFLTMVPPDSPAPTPEQVELLKADPLNGGRAITGNEYLMTTRAVLVMADQLDRKGLANVRAAYPELDTCLKNIDTMVTNYGYVNPRQSIISEGNAPMPDTYEIEAGKHGFIPVTPNGTLTSGPDYTTDHPEILANLAAGEGGVNFDAQGSGAATITANAVGAGPITQSVTVTVNAPLATALTFGDLVVS